MEFPGVLVLGLKVSEGWNTILWSFYGWSLVLSGVFRGKVKNLKVLGGLQKCISSTPPSSPPSFPPPFTSSVCLFLVIAQFVKVVFKPLIPQILLNFAEILSRGSLPVGEPEELQNSCRINFKKFRGEGGHKLDLNFHLEPHERFIRNSHIFFNRVIHLLSGCQVSSSGFFLFSTLPRRNNVYFRSGLIWPILGGFTVITPANNFGMSWHFDRT